MAKEKEVKLALKFDDEGHVVLSETGFPIYVNDEGEESIYDVVKLIKDKQAANNESAGRRKRIEELETQMTELQEKYEGIDVEAARKALETLANIDQQKLMDTEGVESVKRQMKEAFKIELDKERDTWERQVKEREDSLNLKTSQIRNLLVRNAFTSSEYLREKTLLIPDMAYSYFGNYFEVREIDGVPTAVGRMSGEDILSKKNPGELADPEEAIEIIIDKFPAKERILKGNVQAGSGVYSPDQGPADNPDNLAKSLYPSMHKK